eukprot:jgi/Chlat1/6990/Chrsp56S00524
MPSLASPSAHPVALRRSALSWHRSLAHSRERDLFPCLFVPQRCGGGGDHPHPQQHRRLHGVGVVRAQAADVAPSSPPAAVNGDDTHGHHLNGEETVPETLIGFDNNGMHRASTKSVHAGERAGRPRVSDSLTTPIVQTATYTFRDTAELEGRYGSYEYGRYGNPTTRAVEEKISSLEGTEETLLSASGMNAATTMLVALVPPGGHIITTTDCYRRTRQFIQHFLGPKMGITCTVIDPADHSALEDALEKHKVSLFFSESPTNPFLRCIDIPRVSALCHAGGALVCVDGTFATPVNQSATALGADLVIHSATKYLAGHNDVLGGTISGPVEVVKTVRAMHNVLGGVVDPHAAYMILRGMKTLHLRVSRQNATAFALARFLEAHPKVERVHYPGLESHPDHEVARRQMTGFGGVVSFQILGDMWKTAKFIDSLRLPYIAPSLGGVESLVEQPAIISYWQVDQGAEVRAKLGILDNLVRFSCGVEDPEDIIADVEQALTQI